jgi:hypothetical protein
MKRKIKRTAVEWLVNMWEMQGTITPLDIREAKDIEKHQILNTYIEASPILGDITKEASERYYKETFKKK